MERIHSLLTKHLTGVGFNLKKSSWVGPIIITLCHWGQGRTQDLSSRQDSHPRGPWIEEKLEQLHLSRVPGGGLLPARGKPECASLGSQHMNSTHTASFNSNHREGS